VVSAAGRLRLWAAPAAVILGLLAAWQLLAMLTGQAFILPTPLQVVDAGWATRLVLARATLATLTEAALGLALSLALGVGLAAAMDLWAAARRALYPVLVASQTVQILAVAPLLIIWFGMGMLSKVIIVVIVCFFPLAVSTADGLSGTDPDFVALLRVAGARRRQVWRLARLPSALPSFFSGLRLAVAYAIVAATIGEWVGGTEGLGLYMLRSKNGLATDQEFVAMLVTTVLSIGLFVLVSAVERIALPWYRTDERQQSWGEAEL
jgi:ABC-type nitrate/sulfonate/bicarbonate transport system permease component